MSITPIDLVRIETKLDRILDALGLTDNRRMVPCEIQEIARKFVQQHKEKCNHGGKP